MAPPTASGTSKCLTPGTSANPASRDASPGERASTARLSSNAPVEFANRANRPSLKERQKQQNSAFLPFPLPY